jgi:phosphoribosylaminoimidazolecarboxamide formyltransferase / IMP cyclohydrolase
MHQAKTLFKQALISVSDKTGIIEFAKELHELGVKIISTGGTAKALTENGIPNTEISDYTGFPEMMDGRVKTLHPKIHGGILGLRDEHLAVATEHSIDWIDLVVCNLYPFQKTAAKPGVKLDELIENIDIGGPSMLRSCAKNYQYTTVIVDPTDYSRVIDSLKTGGVEFSARQEFAIKAIGHTAEYDTFIHSFLSEFVSKNSPLEGWQTKSDGVDNVAPNQNGNTEAASTFPNQLDFTFTKDKELRYGENPNQMASIYRVPGATSPILDAKIQQGIELSYNNMLDATAGYEIVSEFVEPSCVVIKHTNPCGVATDRDIDIAFQKAYGADSMSAFGGIIAINRECSSVIAESIAKVFAEIVIAPSYSPEALGILSKKKKLRVLEIPEIALKIQNTHLSKGVKVEDFGGIENKNDNNGIALTASTSDSNMEYKFIDGGLMAQEKNTFALKLSDLECKTKLTASTDDLESAVFGWSALKHVKSNAIMLVKDNVSVGIGMGQVSRVDAVNLALNKAGEKSVGSVLLSDAFFPFRDSIDLVAKYGVTTIVQPGGSMKDQEVIDACNELSIAMYFTGSRCFKH